MSFAWDFCSRFQLNCAITAPLRWKCRGLLLLFKVIRKISMFSRYSTYSGWMLTISTKESMEVVAQWRGKRNCSSRPIHLWFMELHHRHLQESCYVKGQESHVNCQLHYNWDALEQSGHLQSLLLQVLVVLLQFLHHLFSYKVCDEMKAFISTLYPNSKAIVTRVSKHSYPLCLELSLFAGWFPPVSSHDGG